MLGEMKTKSDKNLFRKLNEYSKELQAKQEEIAKKHNLLSTQYEELGHLQVNMNEYLGRTKTKEKKESVIGKIKKCKVKEKLKPMVMKEASKEAERLIYGRCGLRAAPIIFIVKLVREKRI